MSLPALPIDDVLPRLVDALRKTDAVVLRAPTGSGKTTRVPPALLDSGLAGAGTVLMLEPRRVAARAAARRISAERRTELGAEVGYQVRFDQKAGPRTRIKIVTDGILIRLLQDNQFLEGISIVIFDEFHERGLNADLALGMVRRLQQTVRPDLKLVVMSATLDAGAVAAYLGNCPVVESQGRLFPVTVKYAPPAGAIPLYQSAADGVLQVLSETAGDVLVFLPGVGEIRRTADLLANTARRDNLLVMPLYGDLPPEQQDAVLLRADRRKIVLATNVAETSVTIDGITSVVDTGYARESQFDATVGLDRLLLKRISRASADQRAGRAGRMQPGVCLRLWSDREQNSLADHESPEIHRVDLAGPLLQLLCWGEPDAISFPWFEAPREFVIDQAGSLLRALGAVGPSGLTELGRAMGCLPVHPRLACLLIEGNRLGIPHRAALAAALLSERDPFLRETGPSTGPRAREASHHSGSDVADRVSALEEFERSGRLQTDIGQLHGGGARAILQVRQQLLQQVQQACGKAEKVRLSADEAIQRSLLTAFPDRVACRREAGSRRAVMVGGRGVRLWERSAVMQSELFVCIDVEAGKGESLVRQASAIEYDWLDPERILVQDELTFDVERERVVALRRTTWDGLVLREVPVNHPADEKVAAVLSAAAAQNLSRVLPTESTAFQSFLARVRCLRSWMPDSGLPAFDEAELRMALATLSHNCRSFEDLRRAPWFDVIKAQLTYAQLQTIDREAPEHIAVPSGSRIALTYEPGRPPVLAVRIQELFGLRETPRIAGGRVPVLLHLLAPNMRPQQVTDDLRSFWDNTYNQVRKDLRRRYPKHAWPEDPWNAIAEKRPGKRS